MRTRFLRGISRWLRNRTGGVVVAYAILAPVMIAGTGIAVDIGYWYQQQTNLQSAADAAAMSLAQGSVAHVVVDSATNSTYVGSSGPGPSIAVAAANNATNSKYGFAATGDAIVAVSGSYTYNAANSTGAASYTANVTAPRRDFFSHVSANVLGLRGMVSGTQSASATVTVNETLAASSGGGRNNGGCTSGSNCACANINSTITNGAGHPNGQFVGTNCGIYAGGSIALTNDGTISGTFVATKGSVTATNSRYGFVGETGSTATNHIGTVQSGSSTPAAIDYLATMGAPPAWPTMPAAVQASSYKAATIPGSNLPVVVPAGSWKGLSSLGEAYNTFNSDYPGGGGTSYFSGGVGGSSGDGTTFYGDTYYFYNGGINFGSAYGDISQPYIKMYGSFYNVQGSSNTYAVNLPAYTDIVGTQPTTSTPASSSQWNQYYFNGGFNLSGNATSVSLASGLYEFSLYSGASGCSIYYCGAAAFNTSGGGSSKNNPTVTFGNCSPPPTAPSNPTAAQTAAAALACATVYPGTYYFDGGINMISGYKYIYFEPGIYYIRNNFLMIGSGVNVIGNGVTFVLEGTAGLWINGAASVNISAPTLASDPNCVSPVSVSGAQFYPESGYSGSNFPYDGTNGHGICDVAIYQAAGDTAASLIDAGGSATVNGSVYMPSSSLTISGAGSLTVTSSGYASLTAANLTMNGGGNVTLTENSPDTSTGGSGSSGGSGGGNTATISYATYLLTS